MVTARDFMQLTLKRGWYISTRDHIANIALFTNLFIQVLCVKLVSPLIVASGENMNRDIDFCYR